MHTITLSPVQLNDLLTCLNDASESYCSAARLAYQYGKPDSQSKHVAANAVACALISHIESSTAPAAATVAGGAFDGTAGAAGGSDYRLELTEGQRLDLLEALRYRRDDLDDDIGRGVNHSSILRDRDDLNLLIDCVRSLKPLESSTAPAASMPAGSFDGTAGAAGGAE